jgi:TonB family protein
MRHHFRVALVVVGAEILICVSAAVGAAWAAGSKGEVPTQECIPKPIVECTRLEPPRSVSRPAPHYPPANGQAAARGRVVLQGNIGSDGKVTDLHVVASDDFRLNPPSLAAVNQWKFDPAKCDERPIIVPLSVTVTFNPTGSFKSKIPVPTCESTW